jgi:hypothetical protein
MDILRPGRQLKDNEFKKLNYSHRHKKLRKQRLLLYKMCEICNREASTDAHHIRYIYDKKDRLTIEDYRALCADCHKSLKSK